jgi:hypothetical protein
MAQGDLRRAEALEQALDLAEQSGLVGLRFVAPGLPDAPGASGSLFTTSAIERFEQRDSQYEPHHLLGRKPPTPKPDCSRRR